MKALVIINMENIVEMIEISEIRDMIKMIDMIEIISIKRENTLGVEVRSMKKEKKNMNISIAIKKEEEVDQVKEIIKESVDLSMLQVEAFNDIRPRRPNLHNL